MNYHEELKNLLEEQKRHCEKLENELKSSLSMCEELEKENQRLKALAKQSEVTVKNSSTVIKNLELEFQRQRSSINLWDSELNKGLTEKLREWEALANKLNNENSRQQKLIATLTAKLER